MRGLSNVGIGSGISFTGVVVRYTEGYCYGVVGQYAYTAHPKELDRRKPEGAERVLPAMMEWMHIQCPMVGMV